jgi:mannose-6-phosphate isomerase-like protein (cupin superfamily)
MAREVEMTVVRVSERPLGPENRPEWCELVGLGMFRIRPNATFDRHFHDSPEYWLFYEGKGKVSVGEETSYVQSGDVVCTPAGAAHDIIEIYEELEGFYFEERLPEGGKIGHQHAVAIDAEGHRIPLRPIPDDFPPRMRSGVIAS